MSLFGHQSEYEDPQDLEAMYEDRTEDPEDAEDYQDLGSDDMDELDREELEVALYSQVHFEPNQDSAEQGGQFEHLTSSICEVTASGDATQDSEEPDQATRNEEKEKDAVSDVIIINSQSDGEPVTKPSAKEKKKKLKKPGKKKNKGTKDEGAKSNKDTKAVVIVQSDTSFECATPVRKNQAESSAAPLAMLLTRLGALSTPGHTGKCGISEKSKHETRDPEVVLTSYQKVQDGKTENKSSVMPKSSSATDLNEARAVQDKTKRSHSIVVIGSESSDEDYEPQTEKMLGSDHDASESDEVASILSVSDSASDCDSSSGDDSSLIVPLDVNEPRTLGSTTDIQFNVNLEKLVDSVQRICGKELSDLGPSLEEIHDSLEDCDWKLDHSDVFGTGNIGTSSNKRYYGKINVHCRNCNEKGHLSKDCNKPKKVISCTLCGEKGHSSNACPNSLCHNCYQSGHHVKDCTQPNKYTKRRYTCHRCNTLGHIGKECPDIWRQFHLTTKEGPMIEGSQKENKRRFCYNCAKGGHFGFMCERHMMDKFVDPVSPFVAQYDDHTHPAGRKRKQDPAAASNEAPTKRKKDGGTTGRKQPPKSSKLSDKITSVAKKITHFLHGKCKQTESHTKTESQSHQEERKGMQRERQGKAESKSTGRKRGLSKRQKKKDNEFSQHFAEEKLEKFKKVSNKKVKLEERTRGDFPRSQSNKKDEFSNRKKQEREDKQMKQISRHMNDHYNRQSGFSPWEKKEKAARKRGGGPNWQSPGTGSKQDYQKGKKGAKASRASEESERTVFVSKRGFRVTTKRTR